MSVFDKFNSANTMLNSKAVVLLSNFSSTDLNQFRKYLTSSFFNENEDLVQLFDLIRTHLLDKGARSKALKDSKDVFWKTLFGSKPYKDAQMRRLNSDLNKHAQNYLAYLEFKKDPFAEQLNLIKALQDSNLEKHLNATIRTIDANFKKLNLANTNYHENKFRIEYQLHLQLERSKAKQNHFDNLENADYHLNCFYISQKLRHYSDLLGYQKFLSKDPQIELFPSFIEYVGQSHFLKEPSIQVYYIICQMFLHPENENHFQELKLYLKDNISAFHSEEQKSLYTYAMNYCIHLQINNGNNAYYAEMFDLYQEALARELLFKNGELDPIHYKNILTVGMHIKAFDWSKRFIKKYTDFLPKENQTNSLNYNLAKVYFHEEDYPRVIEQLREVEYKNQIYALGGKLMLLKTYYELGETNALDSLIDSFRIYLRRNKLISKDVQQQYMNVLRFTKKLVSIPAYDKAMLAKVKTQIEQCKALAAKQWLLQKAGASV